VRVNQEHREQRAPIGTVAVGILSVIAAQLLLLYGYSEIPRKAILKEVAGNITSAKMSCRRRACQALFQIEDADGTWLLAYNDDIAAARRVVQLLNPGDGVSALALLPERGHFEWLWELRRGDELLLSYEQTASAAAAHRLRARVLGYAVAALAILAIMRGVVHFVRFRSWHA